MKETNSLMARALSILGVLGIVLCVAGILGVWYAQNRIDRVVEKVFQRAVQSLIAASRRLSEIEQAVEDAKITMGDVEESLKNRGSEIAYSTLDSRLQLEASVVRLDDGLNRAELLLANAAAAVEELRELLELGEDLVMPVKAQVVAPGLEALRKFQATLETARDAVGRIDETLKRESVEEAPGVQGAIKNAARLVGTFGKLDEGLENCSKRIDQIQDRISKLETKSRLRIFVVALGATVVLLWMGIGQFALWRHASPK